MESKRFHTPIVKIAGPKTLPLLEGDGVAVSGVKFNLTLTSFMSCLSVLLWFDQRLRFTKKSTCLTFLLLLLDAFRKRHPIGFKMIIIERISYSYSILQIVRRSHFLLFPLFSSSRRCKQIGLCCHLISFFLS